MAEDPIVSEVRKIRDQLARHFNFDLKAIFADLREKQSSLGSRLVRRPKRAKAEQVDAPDRDFAAPHPGR